MRARGSKEVSVREFLRRLDLKKHTDITLAFGYYLEHYAGVSQFTSGDINNCYYEAKIERSNTSQMLIHNIRLGRVMEAKTNDKEGKRFTLTATGEQYVESKFNQAAE